MTTRSTKLHTQLREEALSDPETRTEYEAFKLQLDLNEQLKSFRKKPISHKKISLKQSSFG